MELIENKKYDEERALYNIKNKVDSVGEIITEDPVIECNGKVVIKEK